MDTSSIPVNAAFLYDVLIPCARILAVIWGLSRVIQHFKRR